MKSILFDVMLTPFSTENPWVETSAGAKRATRKAFADLWCAPSHPRPCYRFSKRAERPSRLEARVDKIFSRKSSVTCHYSERDRFSALPGHRHPRISICGFDEHRCGRDSAQSCHGAIYQHRQPLHKYRKSLHRHRSSLRHALTFMPSLSCDT